MKKIKNPKRYIERLKNKIAGHDEQYEWLRQKWLGLRGNFVAECNRGEHTRTLEDSFYENLLPGDEVAIIGVVKRVENSIDLTCNNKHGTLVIEPRETRKVSGFLNKEAP